MGGQVLGYREGVDAGGEGLEAPSSSYSMTSTGLHEGVRRGPRRSGRECHDWAARGLEAGHAIIAQRHRGVRTAKMAPAFLMRLTTASASLV